MQSPYFKKTALAVAITSSFAIPHIAQAACPLPYGKITEIVVEESALIISGNCFSFADGSGEILFGQNMNGDLVPLPFIGVGDTQLVADLPAETPPGEYLLELHDNGFLTDQWNLTIPETAGPTGATGPTGDLGHR